MNIYNNFRSNMATYIKIWKLFLSLELINKRIYELFLLHPCFVIKLNKIKSLGSNVNVY